MRVVFLLHFEDETAEIQIKLLVCSKGVFYAFSNW